MWGKEQSGGLWDDEKVVCVSGEDWPKTDMGWDVVPWGLRELLLYITRTYQPQGAWTVRNEGGNEEVSVELWAPRGPHPFT